jgi:hypothetical protein
MVTPFIKENHKDALRNLEANGEYRLSGAWFHFLGRR